MKIYLAPLEGITNYVYRKALFTCFDGFDKYFIPFIRAKQNLNLSGREKKDLMPENNKGMYAVPQILTRKAEDFIRTVELLKGYGYREVNLNLGCPSKTVVTKGCGAGLGAHLLHGTQRAGFVCVNQGGQGMAAKGGFFAGALHAPIGINLDKTVRPGHRVG